MNEAGNAGLIPRNQANFALFSNAVIILAGEAQRSFQRSVLYNPQASKYVAAGQAVSAPASTD